MTPTAPIVELIPPDRRGGTWLVAVECPFCTRRSGKRGIHLHGVYGGDDRAGPGPVLESRVSDCLRGEYELGPLPENFADLVREGKGWRAR